MTGRDQHECFYRGCHELVVGRYHCDRHESILRTQRKARAKRNSENAQARSGVEVASGAEADS
jgi:hypothetical protein